MGKNSEAFKMAKIIRKNLKEYMPNLRIKNSALYKEMKQKFSKNTKEEEII